jgi:hypothetical protein
MITDAIKFVQTNKEKLSMPTKEENKGSKESKDCGVILSRQKNIESKHLEGQKSLDEKYFCSFPYSVIWTARTSYLSCIAHVIHTNNVVQLYFSI